MPATYTSMGATFLVSGISAASTARNHRVAQWPGSDRLPASEFDGCAALEWTNRSDFFDTYNAFIASLIKRDSHRWQGSLNLTLSRSEGLEGATGSTLGQDPNSLTNAAGRLSATDRPVMLTANGSYEIPRIDVRISANYRIFGPSVYALHGGQTAPGVDTSTSPLQARTSPSVRLGLPS